MKIILLLSIFTLISCKEDRVYVWKDRAVCIDPTYKQSEECSNNMASGALAGGLIGGMIKGKMWSNTGAAVGGLAGSRTKCELVTREHCLTKTVITACYSLKHYTYVDDINCFKEDEKQKAQDEEI